MKGQRFNILYIHSHDTGRYIQPYGWGDATPNLQKLADDGVLFRQAFSMAPTCTPSRAALLMGMAPHNVGLYGLINRGFRCPDYSKHLIHALRKVGYKSFLSGIQHIAPDATLIGYDVVLTTESSCAKDAAIEFLHSKPSEPWFLSVGFGETHRTDEGSFASCKEANRKFNQNGLALPPPIPDTPITRADLAEFYASSSVLDRNIGMVLDALESADMIENTLIICTTDHGIAFPKMKCNLTDHGIGVFLIIRGPGGFEGSRVIDALVSQVDIYPTICELLGIAPPKWLQGCSILPLINGKSKEINESIFAEVNYHCAYEPMRAIRTQRWKYIRRFHNYPHPILCNCDDSPTKKLFIESGWAEQSVAREELYDLILDPTESHNLVDDPSAQKVLEEMRTRLEKWMETTNDPLLHGDAPKPKIALISEPSDIGPKDIWQRIPCPEGFS